MVTTSSSELPSTSWLWLRWSWRDLRQHWAAVLSIALVLAIGIGVFAGLGSTATWRRTSNDASFAALSMHDLRVSLNPGTFVESGLLAATVDSIEADRVAARTERLVVESQVDASTTADSVLVAARLVGMDVSAGAAVDALWVRDGSAPTGDAAVLEAKFADHWDLPTEGTIIVGGGRQVDYVGLGMIPEDFFYEGPEGSIINQGGLAPVYVSLAYAQELAGRPGEVNDLVLTVADDADRAALEAELVAALDEVGVSATVTSRDDADAVRVLYDDIENDQRLWNAMAALVLVAAALASFNLVGRIVEAQRREIGIGMALGVPRSQLAIRPLLVGTQVALLGTLAGVGVGMLVGAAMENLLQSFLPLPIYRTPFQPGVYAQAAVLGLVIPIAAAALPVWRAVRVEPIDAIRTGHLTAKTSRLTDWTGRIRLPGSSLTQMPLRNVLRTPRRTILTAVGVAAAITALVAVLGMLDSFGRTIDRAGDELTKGDEDRVLVQLDTFYPTSSGVVEAVADAAGSSNAGLRLPVTALGAGSADDLDLLVELVDYDAAAWTPTVDVAAAAGVDDGILLASKAAGDLGVEAGDTLTLRHLARSGPDSFALVSSDVVVAGIHASPLRAFAYMDASEADRFGLAGMTNILNAYPGPDATRDELQRAVFDLPGVSSSQAVARISEGFDEAIEQFVGFLVITAAAVLVLAMLIAFNATRIAVDERRREHATMRAFGLPVR